MDPVHGSHSDSELCLLSQTSLSVLLDGIDSDTLEASRGIDEGPVGANLLVPAMSSNLYSSNLDVSSYTDPMISGHRPNANMYHQSPTPAYTHLAYGQPETQLSANSILHGQVSLSVSADPLSVHIVQHGTPTTPADSYAQTIPATIQQVCSEAVGISESRDAVVACSPTYSAGSASTTPSPKPVSLVNRHSSDGAFAGDLSFQIHFPTKVKVTKGTPWVFSRQLNKLYVQMGALCPVSFKVSQVTEGLFVRATAFFTDCQNRDQPVHACPVHRDDTNKHLYKNSCTSWIRCPDGYGALTQQDQLGHFGILVPWRGAGTSLEMTYSFSCRNTCVGGPNRRSTSVAFTLENDQGEVLAKQLMEVKVVASPGRDMCKEEAKDCGETTKTIKTNVSTEWQNLPPPGKRKAAGKRVTFSEQPVKKKYYLEMSTRQTYDTLAPLRDSLELLHSFTPEQIRDVTLKNRNRDDTHHYDDTRLHDYTRDQGDAHVSPLCPNTSHISQPSLIKVDRGSLYSPDSSTVDGDPFNCNSVVDKDLKISEWLKSFDFECYADTFSDRGYINMGQILHFTMKHISALRLTAAHGTIILRMLAKYCEESPLSQSSVSGEAVGLFTHHTAMKPDSSSSSEA